MKHFYFKDPLYSYMTRFTYTPWDLCQYCKNYYDRTESNDKTLKKTYRTLRRLFCAQYWFQRKTCASELFKNGKEKDIVKYGYALYEFQAQKLFHISFTKLLENSQITPNDIFLVEMRHFFMEFTHGRVMTNFNHKMAYYVQTLSPSLKCVYFLNKAGFPLKFIFIMKRILLLCEQGYYHWRNPNDVLFYYTEFVTHQVHAYYKEKFHQCLKSLKQMLIFLSEEPLPFYCTTIVHYFIHQRGLDIGPEPSTDVKYVLMKPNTTWDKTSFMRERSQMTTIGHLGEIIDYADIFQEMMIRIQYHVRQNENLSTCRCFHCSKECIYSIVECLQSAIIELKQNDPKTFGHFQLSFEALIWTLLMYVKIVHHVVHPEQHYPRKSVIAFAFYYIMNHALNMYVCPEVIASAFNETVINLHTVELCAMKNEQVNFTSQASPSFYAVFVLTENDVPLHIALLIREYLSIIEHFFWTFYSSGTILYYTTQKVLLELDYKDIHARKRILDNMRIYFCIANIPFSFCPENPLKDFFQCTLNICAERHYLLHYQKHAQ
jgi:hypothetical protein